MSGPDHAAEPAPGPAAGTRWIGRGGLAALGAIALLVLSKLKAITTIVLPALNFRSTAAGSPARCRRISGSLEWP